MSVRIPAEKFDEYVRRRYSFPSAAAMQLACQVANKLGRGGSVTQGDVQAMSAHYPAIPPSVMQQYANQINASPDRRAAMIGAFGFNAADAEVDRIIDQVDTHTHAGDLTAKLDARDKPQPKVEPHPRQEHDRDERRAQIEHLMNPAPPPIPQHVARVAMADRIEQNVVSVGILNSPLVGIEFSPPSDDEEIADGWEGDAGRRCRPEGR